MLDWWLDELSAARPDLIGSVREAWPRDPFGNAFASPSFLEVLAAKARSNGARPILCRGISEQGETAAIWPLMVDARGTLGMLQGPHSDHCTCICTGEIDSTEMARGFAHVLREVRPGKVVLKNVPPWGPTLQGATAGLARLGWPHRSFLAWSCPELGVDPGPDAGQRLAQEVNRHKRIKNYENRLKRSPGYAFEVHEDQHDLEDWATDFCDQHDWRWDRTHTPSRYRFAEARALFTDVLKAWCSDGVLVRFAIRLHSGRVAFVVGLRSANRLVYHHVAVSPSAMETRAGHVLVRLIGLWMCERGFNVLDFGAGEEDYKFRYANGDQGLWRVYAARRVISSSVLKGSVEQRIRSSNRLTQLWDLWVNQRIRGQLRSALRSVGKRIDILRKILSASTPILAVRRLIWRVGAQEEICYRAKGCEQPADPQVVELKTFDLLATIEKEVGLPAGGRAPFYAFRQQGARAFGIIRNGRIMQIAWLDELPAGQAAELPDHKGGVTWRISNCVTARAARGTGLYPRVLKALRSMISTQDTAVICCQTWNRPAQRDILAAGFEPFGLRVTDRRSKRLVFRAVPAACRQ